MFYSDRDPIINNEMGGVCSAYGEKKSTGILWENLRERDHLHDPGVDGRINSDGSSGSGMVACTGLVWFWIGQVTGNYSGKETLGPLQCGEIIDFLRTS
jgi:hypothetical protein